MNVLLLDVDSKIPNLALMKLSTYHKNLGDIVTLVRLGLTGYPKVTRPKVFDAKGYDRVYASTLFTVNRGMWKVKNCSDVLIGGTGVDISKQLPDGVDDLVEDYSIYPDNDCSYGFITRGCIRDCYFCVVPSKEGLVTEYRDWRDIVKHPKTYFLDNNFLSYRHHLRVLQELIDARVKFQFNQGLDIRLVTERNAELLAKSRYLGEFIFAFDDISYERVVERGLSIFRKHYPASWREKFFVYCHPHHSLKDVLFRVFWCRDHQVLPYLMRDSLCWGSGHREFYVDLASWCNQPQFFKNRSFLKYLNDRYPENKERVDRSYSMYEDNI